VNDESRKFQQRTTSYKAELNGNYGTEKKCNNKFLKTHWMEPIIEFIRQRMELIS
jgi:hypothetical protein